VSGRIFVNKKFVRSFLSILLTVLLIFSLNSHALAASRISAGYLDSVIDYIMDNFSGDVEERKLQEGALEGLFDSLDNYTTYYSNEEIENVLGNIEGTYYGIGISMEKKDDCIVVIQVFKGSPAEKAGLMQSDRIILVDGVPVAGKTTEEVQGMIRGPLGSKVKLSIERTGVEGIIEVDVERAEIKLNPVYYEVRGDIGYIKIESFNANTHTYFDEALNHMNKLKISKIVLDLRGNPGGEVSQAINIAKYFVPKGVITKLNFKSKNKTDIVYYSDLSKQKYELAVLVNGTTASASEIIAGAVQDTKAGILVGTNTFGKAQVQSIFPILTPSAYAKYKRLLGVSIINANDLIDKYGIIPYENEIIGWSKMTIGVYVTPSGKIIDKNGLEPDVFVPDVLPVNGIYVNTIDMLSMTGKYDLNSRGIDIYNAEKILRMLEYDTDLPDTLLDKETVKALMKFQEDNKLPVTGILDFETQKVLNEVRMKLLNEYDLQYTKAVQMLRNQAS